MQCSPSFDWNWGKQNDPTACWHQLHPRFRVLQQGKCLSYPPDCVGGFTETPNCVGGEGTSPFEPPLMGGHPPLKFPPYSLFRPNGGRKTIIFLSHFHGLVSDTNYKHLECFIMLGTLSETRRDQMSHICDISALKVSCILYKSLLIGVCSIVVLSLASQTPPLFEIGWQGGSLVNRVDFSVPAKEFGHRCWYENYTTCKLWISLLLVKRWRVEVHCFFFFYCYCYSFVFLNYI